MENISSMKLTHLVTFLSTANDNHHSSPFLSTSTTTQSLPLISTLLPITFSSSIHHNKHTITTTNNNNIMPRGIKKEHLPTKICIMCQRSFNWRKKWEKCWNEVTTCSKSCNRQRRTIQQQHLQKTRSNSISTTNAIGIIQLIDHEIDRRNNNNQDTIRNDEIDFNHSSFVETESKTTTTIPLRQSQNEYNVIEHKNHHHHHNNNMDDTLLSLGNLIVNEEEKDENQDNEVENNKDDQNKNIEEVDDDNDNESECNKQEDNDQYNENECNKEEEKEEDSIVLDSKAARKAAKKLAKLERRAKREGKADPSHGQKTCDLCQKQVDLLIRCTIDASGDWKMVCGKCWHQVSGGVVDGDANHPYYRYGGLWKNRSKRS